MSCGKAGDATALCLASIAEMAPDAMARDEGGRRAGRPAEEGAGLD